MDAGVAALAERPALLVGDHDGQIVRQRVGDADQLLPGRQHAHQPDERRGEADHPHEALHRVATAARVHELAQPARGVERMGRAAVVEDEGRLVQREPLDREAGPGRLERDRRSGRHREHVGGAAGGVDHRGEILDLALE